MKFQLLPIPGAVLLPEHTIESTGWMHTGEPGERMLGWARTPVARSSFLSQNWIDGVETERIPTSSFVYWIHPDAPVPTLT